MDADGPAAADGPRRPGLTNGSRGAGGTGGFDRAGGFDGAGGVSGTGGVGGTGGFHGAGGAGGVSGTGGFHGTSGDAESEGWAGLGRFPEHAGFGPGGGPGPHAGYPAFGEFPGFGEYPAGGDPAASDYPGANGSWSAAGPGPTAANRGPMSTGGSGFETPRAGGPDASAASRYAGADEYRRGEGFPASSGDAGAGDQFATSYQPAIRDGGMDGYDRPARRPTQTAAGGRLSGVESATTALPRHDRGGQRYAADPVDDGARDTRRYRDDRPDPRRAAVGADDRGRGAPRRTADEGAQERTQLFGAASADRAAGPEPDEPAGRFARPAASGRRATRRAAKRAAEQVAESRVEAPDLDEDDAEDSTRSRRRRRAGRRSLADRLRIPRPRSSRRRETEPPDDEFDDYDEFDETERHVPEPRTRRSRAPEPQEFGPRDPERRGAGRRGPEPEDFPRRESRGFSRRDESRDFGQRDPDPRDRGRGEVDARGSGRRAPGPPDFGRRDAEPRGSGRRDVEPRDFDRREPGSGEFARPDPRPRDFDRRDPGPRDIARQDPGRREADSRDFGRREAETRGSGRREPDSRDYGRRESEVRDPERRRDPAATTVTRLPAPRAADVTERRPAPSARSGRGVEDATALYALAEPIRDAVLSTVDLVKVHSQGLRSVTALDGVTLDVARCRFTAIMGASGSGKSTLLHCLAGLDKPTRGTVQLGSTDLTRVSERRLTQLRRDRIGFVFQSYDLLPQLTVRQNILLPIEVAGAKLNPGWLNTVLEALELGDLLRQLPTQLSLGEQQRVAVARAVLPRPDVVLADEPTGALDAGTTREMVGFLRASVDHLGQTVVMVTHDPLAAQHADRAVILNEGRLVGEVAQPTAHGVLDALAALAESPVRASRPRPAPADRRAADRGGSRWSRLGRRSTRRG